MSRRRTTEEQLTAVEEKLKKLEASKKQLAARKKEEDRKKRNHRLIVLGGQIEKILGRKLTDEDIPRIRRFLMDQERRGKYFSRAVQEKEDDTTEDAGEYR